MQRERAFIDLMRDISAVKREAPVGILDFYGVDAEIALLLRGEFLRLRIQ